MTTKFDIAIIGGGIVGLAIAYRLIESKPYLKIVLLEKEKTIAQHQTGHNSGVIHSGIYYTPGSLRATNCIQGYHSLLEFCDKNEISYKLCGKLIVASNEEECSRLDKILKNGLENGLTGIEKITKEEALEIEPHIGVAEAIRVPQAGIVDYKEVAAKYAELFQKKGGTIWTNNKLIKVNKSNGHVQLVTSEKELEVSLVINCAGLYSDKIAQMTGQQIDFQILPFRGEYYELKKEKEYLVNQLIYPVPNPNFPFLGVHFTPLIYGGIEAGPNAVLAYQREGYTKWDFNFKEFSETIMYSGFQQLAKKYWRDGAGELYRSYSKSAFVNALKKLIPEIKDHDLQRGKAGVRAMACGPNGELIDDYIILENEGLINVCNAPSPAATSSLSIGKTVMEKALKQID